MHWHFYALVSIFAVCALSITYEGGHVSDPLTSADFACARQSGWRFVIARSYKSTGEPDLNVKQNLDNINSVGFVHRDVSHYPCFKKVSASQQIRDSVSDIRGKFDRMWIHIEANASPGCEWSLGRSSNCMFLTELIATGSGLGVKMGIFSSLFMWNSIMGPCDLASKKKFPLAYIDHDGQPTFKRFQPFGGWSAPSMKQYTPARAVDQCGFEAERSWYERPFE